MGSYASLSKSHKFSNDVGCRLVPTVIDEKATSTPRAVWCSLPYDDSDLSKGYEDITYATLSNAINKLSWIIYDNFGPSDRFETIAYMGKPDIRYHIVQTAVAKTGYQVLFSSHMNSVAGHLSLMDKTNVTIMLVASGVQVDDILVERSLKCLEIPELETLLTAEQVNPYPYTKTFDEAKNDPFLILHTSGSTGLPKPIVHTHGQLGALDHHGVLPRIDETSGLPIRTFFTSPGRPLRMLIPFLHFHSICAAVLSVGAVFNDLVYIPGFRNKMVTSSDIPSILSYCAAECAFLSPAMAEDLARNPEAGPVMSKLTKVLYGGAPITEHAGKILSQYTYLQDQWGMTETLKLVDLEPAPEDFAYCGFDTKHSGITFEPVTDGLYEMVVRRTPDSYPNAGVFWRCPEDDVLRPGDLWSRHPDPKKSAYLWRYEGRTDDMICWKDGTNFNPLFYESKHSEYDLIKSTVIAGTNHRQGVLLIELHDKSQEDEATIISKIWENSVVKINEVAPTNGQIAKTHIIVAKPGKPFQRNVKGSVSRKATLKQYEEEIENIYQVYGDSAIRLDGRVQKE